MRAQDLLVVSGKRGLRFIALPGSGLIATCKDPCRRGLCFDLSQDLLSNVLKVKGPECQPRRRHEGSLGTQTVHGQMLAAWSVESCLPQAYPRSACNEA